MHELSRRIVAGIPNDASIVEYKVAELLWTLFAQNFETDAPLSARTGANDKEQIRPLASKFRCVNLKEDIRTECISPVNPLEVTNANDLGQSILLCPYNLSPYSRILILLPK
eukprot:3337445-Pleurochrysis_carterae.AAC.2